MKWTASKYYVDELWGVSAEVSGIVDRGVTELTIPAQVRLGDRVYPVAAIGYRALEKCTALTKLTLPETMNNIREYGFFGCTALKTLTLPEGVANIEKGAFRGCTALTSVTFPSSLTNIGGLAFAGCDALNHITILAPQAPTASEGAFGQYDAVLQTAYDGVGYDQGEWAKFTQRNPFLDLIDLIDQFTAPKEEVNVKVAYTRIFIDTKWQPLFVPFDIAVRDLGDKFVVAALQDEQGAGMVKLKMLGNGETLKGNSIALIRAKQTGEQTLLFPATTLRASEQVVKTLGDFTFRGTLQLTDGAEHTNGWMVAEGKMRRVDANEQIGNFRWYVEGKDGAVLDNVKYTVVGDNDPTAIGRIQAEGQEHIFDLSGRRLDAKTARGTVRIVNGQKTF